MKRKQRMDGQKSIKVAVDRTFTDNELLLIQMTADGRSREEIAEAIDKSKRTVESKLDKLRREFGCANVPNLVAFFFRNKLIN